MIDHLAASALTLTLGLEVLGLKVYMCVFLLYMMWSSGTSSVCCFEMVLALCSWSHFS